MPDHLATSTSSTPSRITRPNAASYAASPTSVTGPSTPRRGPSTPATAAVASDGEDEEDEDGDRPAVETLRSLARQVHAASGRSHPSTKVIIPKRGEKDFEPLDETVNIQGKMLRESREALFDALGGVRGSSSKSISHALLRIDKDTYPKLKVTRGNMFLTTGHTIREPLPAVPSTCSTSGALDKGKSKQPFQTHVELLPEEALYLLERGSLQIWVRSPLAAAEEEAEADEWDEEIQGFRGAVEMSAMEAYGRFIGQDGLSLERYQVYAGLKRLGYTVQRTRRFLPPRFEKTPTLPPSAQSSSTWLEAMRRIWTSLAGAWTTGMLQIRVGWRRCMEGSRWVVDVCSRALGGTVHGSLLGEVKGGTYRSLFDKIRFIPAGHSHPITISSPSTTASSIESARTTDSPYAPLSENPYIPFFHVWKPSTNWSRNVWDRGSDQALTIQPPDFWVAVVDARSTSFPSLKQLEEVFPGLPELKKAYLRPRAPRILPSNQGGNGGGQAGGSTPSKGGQGANIPVKPAATQPVPAVKTNTVLGSMYHAMSSLLPARFRSAGTTAPSAQKPQLNTYLTLKQGDRSLIVAINDGGNIGWTRLGRGGFEEQIMVQM